MSKWGQLTKPKTCKKKNSNTHTGNTTTTTINEELMKICRGKGGKKNGFGEEIGEWNLEV